MAGTKDLTKWFTEFGAHFWGCLAVAIGFSAALNLAFDLAWWQRALVAVATIVLLEVAFAVARYVRPPADA